MHNLHAHPAELCLNPVQWLPSPANIDGWLTNAIITMGLHVVIFIGVLQILVSIVSGIVCAQSNCWVLYGLSSTGTSLCYPVSTQMLI